MTLFEPLDSAMPEVICFFNHVNQLLPCLSLSWFEVEFLFFSFSVL